MYVSTITALAVLAASASAKQCINTTVPVNLTARQAVFNLDVPQTNLEATDFILNITQRAGTLLTLFLPDTIRRREHTISALSSVCRPMTTAPVLPFKS
jgi:hypothetical protein